MAVDLPTLAQGVMFVVAMYVLYLALLKDTL